MNAFERLHPALQRVLWDLKWESLRDLQVSAINAWFDRQNDLILMANTAAGKTEAAFLPILSMLAPDRGADSVRTLYIGPLKALINDQFRRVEELCARAEIPVHRWHGDVSAAHKADVVSNPSGVLLITPESLEALFIRRGRELRRVFAHLDAVVIDEMHVFLDSERGRQLITQLERLDALREPAQRARRVGLSATIGGIEDARSWLGGGVPERVELISSHAAQDIELLIKSVLPFEAGSNGDGSDDDEMPAMFATADHIFEHFHGETNLIFGNRKSDLEWLADRLRTLCERHGVRNVYRVHHGSLSKPLREETEAQLHSGNPCTVLCSSTLELGIDVGKVDAVGQIDPPFSVSSLKQRLGRSGRRSGSSARMWLYVLLERCTADAPLCDRLYPDLLQAVALVELMLAKWVEPPGRNDADFSTLVQQTLSFIAERGGVPAAEIYRLINRSPAFRSVDARQFAQFLRDLGGADLIEQAPSGDLILGLKGERLVGNYEFYSAFFAGEDFEVFNGSRHIGSLSARLGGFKEQDNFLLAGVRWVITSVNLNRKVLQVQRSKKRQALNWGGSGGSIHPEVREKMRALLCRNDVPAWLNPKSAEVLSFARKTAQESGVTTSAWIDEGGQTWLMTWTGGRAQHTLELALISAGVPRYEINNAGIGFSFASKYSGLVRDSLQALLTKTPPASALIETAFPDTLPAVGKHGEYLSRELQVKAYECANLDLEGALSCARSIRPPTIARAGSVE